MSHVPKKGIVMRDSQRSRVYKAEDSFEIMYPSKEFKTIKETRDFVDKVTTSSWFKKHWPNVYDIQVDDGRAQRRALAKGPRHIGLPRWSRTEAIILHEISHCCTWKIGAAHGREFCKTLIRMVQHFMGKEAANHLKVCFKEHRVRYDAPLHCNCSKK